MMKTSSQIALFRSVMSCRMKNQINVLEPVSAHNTIRQGHDENCSTKFFCLEKFSSKKNALDCRKMPKINTSLKELAPIYFHDFRLFRLCSSYLCIYLCPECIQYLLTSQLYSSMPKTTSTLP